MGKMTIGELESSVSPEDRNWRNPVPGASCFILNTPFRMSFEDQVRIIQEESGLTSQQQVFGINRIVTINLSKSVSQDGLLSFVY
jgi:hypothetical protein